MADEKKDYVTVGPEVARTIYKRAHEGAPLLATIGSTGLVRHAGTVDEEWQNRLRGVLGVRTWREMRDNDSVIGNATYLIEALIRQARWTVKPAETKNPDAEKWADFLEGCMEDMEHTWNEFLSEVLSFMWFGWSWFEKVHKVRGGKTSDPRTSSKYDDGLIGWRKISIRAQETLDDWEFADDGALLGMWQLAAPDYQRVFIPSEKSVLFRTQVNKGNPEGRSLLRNAWRSWFFLKRMQEIEAVGIERDLVGLPVINLPDAYMNASAGSEKAQARAEFATLIQQIRRNEHEGVLFPAEQDSEGNPTGFRLSLLSSGGSRQIDVSETVKRYQRDIAMTLMTQFSFLGMDQVGSFSLSSDQTSMFATTLGYLMDTIEETFHRFATVELMEVNGVDPELHPRIVHGDVEKEDVERFVSVVSGLIGAGLLQPDKRLEDFARDKLGLPERETKEAEDAGTALDDDFEHEDEEPMQPADAALKPEDAGEKKEEPVANTAMNGAQITSLVTIVQQVAAGDLPKESAQAIIERAFPYIGSEGARDILAPVQEAPEEPADAMPPQPPPPPGQEPPEPEGEEPQLPDAAEKAKLTRGQDAVLNFIRKNPGRAVKVGGMSKGEQRAMIQSLLFAGRIRTEGKGYKVMR